MDFSVVFFGWGGRIRTYDPGTKTRCLTAWLRPNGNGFYCTASLMFFKRLVTVKESCIMVVLVYNVTIVDLTCCKMWIFKCDFCFTRLILRSLNMITFIFFVVFSACNVGAYGVAEKDTWAVAFFGSPKYCLTDKHMGSVNSHAPKGGVFRLGVVGSFENLNYLSPIGVQPIGLLRGGDANGFVYESLMRRSVDEIFTLYGLLAESVEIAPDSSWMTLHLNPMAQWSDGRPVTTKDVLFTHHLLQKYGRGFLRLEHNGVKEVRVFSPRSMTFFFHPSASSQNKSAAIYSRERPFNVAVMTVLPEHFFKDTDFSKPVFEIGPGSGPYKVSSVDMGRYIEYQRRPDYWAAHHLLNRGLYNFDVVQCRYFVSEHVCEEALKSHETDYMILSAKQFYVLDEQKTAHGHLKKLALTHDRPVAIHSLVLNQRQRSFFKDPRVRCALSLIVSFKKKIIEQQYYNLLKPLTSYVQGTLLCAANRLSVEERHALSVGPFNGRQRHFLKKKLTTYLAENEEEYRRNLGKADQLLQEAGWHLKQGKRVNAHGKTMSFELMVCVDEDEKLGLLIAHLMKKMGVIVRVSRMEHALYWKKVMMGYDFDSIFFSYGGTQAPGSELYGRWHSDGVKTPNTLNFPGVNSRLMDQLALWIPTIFDKKTYVGAIRLLDRALQKGKYVVPLFYSPVVWVAFWDRFGMPSYDPRIGLRVVSWWAKSA